MMNSIASSYVSRAACLSALLALSACAQSSLRLSPDFGKALHEDLAAQIAEPDPHYIGAPDPGSNGARVGLAQTRYQKNAVIPPATTTATSSITANGNGGGSGAGAAAGAAAQ